MTKDRRKVKGRPAPKKAREAWRVKAEIRETGKLPTPRVEVAQLHKKFGVRVVNESRQKSAVVAKFSRRNNARRFALKAYPGMPIVSR